MKDAEKEVLKELTDRQNFEINNYNYISSLNRKNYFDMVHDEYISRMKMLDKEIHGRSLALNELRLSELKMRSKLGI